MLWWDLLQQLGKTSFLQLIEQAYCKEYKPTQVVWMEIGESMDPQFLFSHLERFGIRRGSNSLANLGDTLLLVDDAQNANGDKFNGFWQFLVKAVGSARKKGKLFVVIASTHCIEIPGSPVVLRNLPHIPSMGETLALSSEEADQLFHMHAVQRGYGLWTIYRDALKEISNCHIGVIIQGLLLLEEAHNSNRQPALTEKEAIDMLRGDRFLDSLFRCFQVKHLTDWNDEVSRRHQELVTNELLGTKQARADPFIQQLNCAGVFGMQGGFTSIVTNWYYNRKFFSFRATTVPASLEQLIVQSVESMSSSRLRASRGQPGNTFPNEAAFQHLFNEVMSVNLPLWHPARDEHKDYKCRWINTH